MLTKVMRCGNINKLLHGAARAKVEKAKLQKKGFIPEAGAEIGTVGEKECARCKHLAQKHRK